MKLRTEPDRAHRPVSRAERFALTCASTGRNETKPNPARQERSSGAQQPRTAGTPFGRQASTAGRPNRPKTEPSNRSNQTNRRAADRPRRVIDETRLEPTSEPHHQQKRRPAPTLLLLSGHGATPTMPRQDKTSTPRAINENHSFYRNASSTAKSIRSSAVPAERHQAVRAAVRTPRSAGARQPTALTSNRLVPSKRSTVRSSRTPASRPDRSSTTSQGGLRFASPQLVHAGRPGQRADQPTSERHQCRITPSRRNALHTSYHRDAPLNAQAAERQSPRAAFIATCEGVSHRSG